MSAIKKRLADACLGLALLPSARFGLSARLPPKHAPAMPHIPTSQPTSNVEAALEHTGLTVKMGALGQSTYFVLPSASLGVEVQTFSKAQSLVATWEKRCQLDPKFTVTSGRVQSLIVTLRGDKLSVQTPLSPKARAFLRAVLAKKSLRFSSRAKNMLHQASVDTGVVLPRGTPSHATQVVPYLAPLEGISPLPTTPPKRPLRIVLTGFGSFLNIALNPSELLAKEVATLGLEDAVMEYRKLEVTTEAVDAFVAEMKTLRPDIILSMGLGFQAQIEDRPENRIAKGAIDGQGKKLRKGPIVPGGPPYLKTDLPLGDIENVLSALEDARAIETRLSGQRYDPDDSAYLCNYLTYLLSHTFGPEPRVTAGFMHVIDGTPAKQVQLMLRAIAARVRRDEETTVTTPVPVA